MTKIIPNKKKCKKEKWLSEEALQMAEKRREAKEKRKDIPIWKQSSKEFQGEVREPSLGMNNKELEENRSGKTRECFKKIRDTKGTFHAKMDRIQDRGQNKSMEMI